MQVHYGADDVIIEGVILAAGSSARAGSFKMGLPLGGKTLIERSIEGMHDICGRIIVVGGYDIERLRSSLSGIPKVECVENTDYAQGMFTSVKTGVSHLHGDVFFLLPADIPLVPTHVYRKLLGVKAPVVIPAFRGTRGHPVLLNSSMIPAILSEPDSSSLREVLRRTAIATIEVEAEEILIDVDTPEDYQRILQRFL
jgi:molybdenum cofactor cytidylyltransferase